VRIFPRVVFQAKKSLLRKPYSTKYSSKGRGSIVRYKDVTELSNVKLYPLGGNPTEFVVTSLSYSKGVQQVKKRSKDIHLLIMSISDKACIPLMRIIG
jgi:hypothetical protein